MGTQAYMTMTKSAMRLQMIDRGIVTDLSEMSMRARLALPVRVAVLFASSTYFWTTNIASVMQSRTTAIAAAPSLS